MNIEYKEIKVNNIKEKTTIYTYLKSLGYSESFTKKLRKSSDYILLNDNKSFITRELCNGDIIKININPNTKSCIKPCNIHLDIVYEDYDLLIVNKPSGIACMPTKSHYDYNLSGAIMNYMLQKDNNFVCRIINRLDKDTAGLVIIAKNSLAANTLSKQENTRKIYHAICEGIISTPITIDKNISTEKDENGIIIPKRLVGKENGKQAITYVTPIKTFENYSLVRLTLKHGRTHQIRAHLSSINHALLGDSLYGKPCDKINHTALVCSAISLTHPTTNKTMDFSIEFPNDLNKLLIGN